MYMYISLSIICMYVCMYVCMYEYIHIYIHICIFVPYPPHIQHPRTNILWAALLV